MENSDHSHFLGELEKAQDTLQWMVAMEDYADSVENGYADVVNPNVSAFFAKRGDILLVAFDTADNAFERKEDRRPNGWSIAEKNNWSYLGLVSEKRATFLDGTIVDYFEELDGQKIFAPFSRIVFLGAKEASAAACIYSAFCPGSYIVVVDPLIGLTNGVCEQLDANLGKEDLVEVSKSLNLAIEAAKMLILAADPKGFKEADDMKNLSQNFHYLRCWHMGSRTELFIRRMGVLDSLLQAAASKEPSFAFLPEKMRSRRNHKIYLRNLLRKVESKKRKGLAKKLCQYVVSTQGGHFFKQKLAQLKLDD